MPGGVEREPDGAEAGDFGAAAFEGVGADVFESDDFESDAFESDDFASDDLESDDLESDDFEPDVSPDPPSPPLVAEASPDPDFFPFASARESFR